MFAEFLLELKYICPADDFIFKSTSIRFEQTFYAFYHIHHYLSKSNSIPLRTGWIERRIVTIGYQIFININGDFKIKMNIFNQTIEGLVKDGYNGIITTSTEFTAGTEYYAKLYINNTKLYWMTRGRSTNTTNLSYFTYNIGICQYIVGYFAGLWSKTGQIGYVAPGLPDVANYNANALFVGARAANPNATVHTWNTGGWYMVDEGIGATNDLMSKGIDIVSQNQNDMTVEVEAMKHGLIGLGTNGYPFSRVYGPRIGFSFVNNWTMVFVNFTELIINDANHSTKTYGDFDNFLSLDKFSFTVNTTIVDKVTAEIHRLIGMPREKHPYFCNEYNHYVWDGMGVYTNNCMTTPQFFLLNDPYPGMTYYGYYQVPLTKIEDSNGLIYGYGITAGVLILICIVMICLIQKYNTYHAIRSASPFFSINILFGGIITYAAVIIYVIPKSTVQCNVRFWLLAIGYSLLIGSLVIKNIRIWLIFRDSSRLQMRKITNTQLYPFVAALVGVMVVLLSILAAPSIGNHRAVDSNNGLGKYEFEEICVMSNEGSIVLYVLLSVFALLIFMGVFVSWKIRIVDIEEFNESKQIANTLYAVLVSIFIVVPLMVSPQTQSSETIIICSSALFITTISLMILFIPKFYKVYRFGKTPSSNPEFLSAARSPIAVQRSEKSGSGHTSGKGSSFHDEEASAESKEEEPVVGEEPEPEEEQTPVPIHATFDSDDEDEANRETPIQTPGTMTAIVSNQNTEYN
ncbi:G-protein-coupled receptor family 3 protein 3 [Heterostelium album PN500]|uniref:G-protein-coupled receptor family 3 protein 3 n=1 Tax=Heterostelium pallidum (strain ATCC 26659 / Pp 5 / PN500) TaxID=670386 RepID=D3B620_HETP5|nr:G-protein-coupled receptor family 3 protein 3 [Heterostelium album PN500]EFA83318.1 G-protein-coupled receptor family 3 protein 3 [Heterostelium album PN500]|eukprot:XP_020435435.1 G-protein-coupled receptor family 3 protein 3 [Heterostelium album PN500]